MTLKFGIVAQMDLRYFPEMDPDFPRWWMDVNGLTEARHEDVSRAWREGCDEFNEYRKENLSYKETVEKGKQVRDEVTNGLQELRAAIIGAHRSLPRYGRSCLRYKLRLKNAAPYAASH